MAKVIVQRIDHVTVNVTDVPRAKAYYGALLGLEEVPRPVSFDFPGAWYRIGEACLHLVGQSQADPPTSKHFALWVADAQAAAQALESAGHKIRWAGHRIPGVARFFTNDPDGNSIEFQGPEK